MAKLIYVAVSTDYNGLVNRFYKNVLYNPVRQRFDTLIGYKRDENSVNFADSGGFQIASTEGSDEKRCIVKIGAGIQVKKDLTIIDPIDLCRQYGKLDIRYGFTLDNPFWDNTTTTLFILIYTCVFNQNLPYCVTTMTKEAGHATQSAKGRAPLSCAEV